MVVINLVLIAMIVLHSTGHDRSRGPSSHMLDKQLDLNEAQEKQFEDLRNQHFKVVEPKMDRIRELKKSLMNATESNEAEQIASSIGQLEGEIDFLTFEHFRKVREMCTPEQKQKMDEIKKRISERMSQKNRRNHSSRPNR